MQIVRNGLPAISKAHRTKTFGMNARVVKRSGAVVDFHNLTEIHYAYPTAFDDNGYRCAFESDIDGTGTTIDIKDIKELEVVPAPYIEADYQRTKALYQGLKRTTDALKALMPNLHPYVDDDNLPAGVREQLQDAFKLGEAALREHRILAEEE